MNTAEIAYPAAVISGFVINWTMMLLTDRIWEALPFTRGAVFDQWLLL